MKIVKFNEFIKEQMDGLVDTVETNSEILLKVLKSKIEKMFDEEEVDEDEVMTLKKAKNPLRINKSLHLKRFGWFRYEVSMKNKDSNS
jgi:seryl-tRNA(Sec) selenium transferase